MPGDCDGRSGLDGNVHGEPGNGAERKSDPGADHSAHNCPAASPAGQAAYRSNE
jgi:hypothetical protein